MYKKGEWLKNNRMGPRKRRVLRAGRQYYVQLNISCFFISCIREDCSVKQRMGYHGKLINGLEKIALVEEEL